MTSLPLLERRDPVARHDRPDVLVIGAGMGGATVSLILSRAGFKVTCLEQGGWVRPSEHPHYERDWELEKLRRWSMNPNVRQLPEDYPVTGGATCFMYNGVGGSTVHYNGMWMRYKPVDFRKGTEHGLEGTIDWPISYEDLAPYYEWSDALIGVSGSAGDPANPLRPGREFPPLKPGRIGHRAADGFEELGWHWWPSDLSILNGDREQRSACNLCGNCINGCPTGALGNVAYSHWPEALRNGVDLRTDARVETLEMDGGRCRGAVYVDRGTGRRHRVEADCVILAANGVGTPRLLLASAQKGSPNGVANRNDFVGRHLMHHSVAYLDCWFDEPMEGFKGASTPSLFSQQFYDTDVARGCVNGISMLVLPSFGASNAAMGMQSRETVPWGSGHHAEFARSFGRHMVLLAHVEDLPVAANRVTLDPDVTDNSGIPAPRVEYTFHPNDIRLTDFGIERLREVADAMGAVKTATTGLVDPAWGIHLLGTGRMGHSPEDSVCNRYNQTWEVPNLFIADGSTLTTSASVTPTSTIAAVAARCADFIVRHGQRVGSAHTSSVESWGEGER